MFLNYYQFFPSYYPSLTFNSSFYHNASLKNENFRISGKIEISAFCSIFLENDLIRGIVDCRVIEDNKREELLIQTQ